MNIFVDIDNTICRTDDTLGTEKYNESIPMLDRIAYVNSLYDAGNRITYWTARGNASGKDYSELTRKQLEEWGCRYHVLSTGSKPSFDLLIDDKAQCANAIEYPPISKKITPQIVPKGWGHEVIFVNNDKYCGKILHFKEGARFSMHYHLKKMETWYVASGKFLFKYIDTRNADIKEMELNIGDSVTNQLGEPHQIICVESGDIFEVSTTHYDSDSYRVMKGDSQAQCKSC
jgi:mannose-6-phosphate isomerase-like protein (cupin superfamily)